MDQAGKIEFEVDGQYENEKGIFKVVSIDRNEMVIRWENGEEVRTEIDLQRRIAERRRWEKRQREAAKEAAQKSSARSASRKKKTAFDGFAATDFKKSAQKTTWRSRNQLGMLVAGGIENTQLAFSSWAFRNKPEMHVQDTKHRESTALDNQAKFFVRVDQRALYFGLQLPRPESDSDNPADWEAFLNWLGRPENEKKLQAIAVGRDLTVSNHAQPHPDVIVASDNGWHLDTDEVGEKSGTLSAHIAGIPAADELDLEIAARMAKDDAIAEGKNIAAKIAELYTELLPLYEAIARR